MELKLSITEIPSYLRWRDPLLDLRYRFDSQSADYSLTRIFTSELEEDLVRYQIMDVAAAKEEYTAEIAAAQRKVYFYRSSNLMFLTVFILLPSVALYFLQDNWVALVFALLFSFLMFFLVECFNQAYLNKFQKLMFERLQIEDEIQKAALPFHPHELTIQDNSAIVEKEGFPLISDQNYSAGDRNIVHFELQGASIHPHVVVKNL
ncbi:MAG TPA: hypothetical protein VK945_14325 [Planococcus sp. (in: firmicutes)]|nr:hypothetical protein [Planococcus sp. (in: firmicutes)]